MSIMQCPRCGKGALFSGLLTIAERCGECGLAFHGREQGDGPAFLSILIVGALAGVFAAIVDVRYAPPIWVHVAVWPLFIVGTSLLSLRWLKAGLVTMQYRVRGDKP